MAKYDYFAMSFKGKGELSLKKSSGTKSGRNKTTALIMIIPALIFLIWLKGYPLIKVIHDSFYQVSLIKPGGGFAGLDNFKVILADERFNQTVINTVYWTVFSVFGEYILGMVTAVLLNREFKGRAIFRTLIFIPWLVPIIVAGMTWSWMLNTEFGVFNYILRQMKLISRPIDFLGDARYALAVVTLINIWRSFPYYTISFLSALQSIPNELMEAAAIDGAGIIKRFFYITLPQLKSVSLVIIFLHIIWTAINFDFIWILTEGGPNYATQTLPIMIYRYSMKKFNVGAASALSTMMFAVMAVIFIIYYRQRMKISESLE